MTIILVTVGMADVPDSRPAEFNDVFATREFVDERSAERWIMKLKAHFVHVGDGWFLPSGTVGHTNRVEGLAARMTQRANPTPARAGTVSVPDPL